MSFLISIDTTSEPHFALNLLVSLRNLWQNLLLNVSLLIIPSENELWIYDSSHVIKYASWMKLSFPLSLGIVLFDNCLSWKWCLNDVIMLWKMKKCDVLQHFFKWFEGWRCVICTQNVTADLAKIFLIFAIVSKLLIPEKNTYHNTVSWELMRRWATKITTMSMVAFVAW